MLHHALKLPSRILDSVSASFSPSPAATTRDVRINGAITVAAGIFCFVAYGLSMFLLPTSDLALKLGFVPTMAGYAFLLVGGYRLVFGVSATARPHEIMSLKRIAFGVTWVIFVFGVLVGMAYLFLPS